jgi:ubiquinone/menaquinone biosynthesis C-methylase UbiE
MKPVRDLMRLQRFYGAVASDQNRSILRWTTGEKLLELGCGYGTFVQEARTERKEAFGLDIDFSTLKAGLSVYPEVRGDLIQGDMAYLPFKENSFHTVVLRESLHHVPWAKILPEIIRICRREILIFEPNPNGFLRLSRKIISHQDQEVPPDPLVNYLRGHGVVVQGILYRDLIAFPLSGGFVGWELVPPIKALFSFLLWSDRIVHALLCFLRIEKAVSWRYLVKGVKKESEEER